MDFYCKKCGMLLTSNLQEIQNMNMLSLKEGSEMIPSGYYFISKGEYVPERKGDILVNINDVINTKLVSKQSRLNGCCGLDGLDGPNLMCENNHEVGTKRDDCWLSHHVLFAFDKVKNTQYGK